MPSVAEQLRHARETQNLTVQELSETTKIRSDYIRALEEGNYDSFSAPVYVRGFVRSYAQALKLSIEPIMEELKSELARNTRMHENPLQSPSNGWLDALMYQLSKVNWRVVLPVLILGLFILSGWWIMQAWNNHRNRDPLADLGPGIYQPTRPAQGDALSIPPVGPSTGAPPSRAR